MTYLIESCVDRSVVKGWRFDIIEGRRTSLYIFYFYLFILCECSFFDGWTVSSEGCKTVCNNKEVNEKNLSHQKFGVTIMIIKDCRGNTCLYFIYLIHCLNECTGVFLVVFRDSYYFHLYAPVIKHYIRQQNETFTNRHWCGLRFYSNGYERRRTLLIRT